MKKLIRLELRKNKLTPYFCATLCIFVVGLGLCFMLAVIPQLEAMTGGLPTPVDMEMFTQWSTFSMLVSIIFVASFAIMSAVMHTKFTVEEYTGKRAVLLFSYPQSRSRILLAKCGLVSVYTTVATAICNTLAVLTFAAVSNAVGILPTAFELSMVPSLLSLSGICGLLAASVGLIAMRVGFWKKSLVATVVTAVILVSPFGNIVSLLPQYSATIQLVAMVVLLVIAVLIVAGLLAQVNKMEAA